MEKVVFLDRDGVINRKAPMHQYITCWEDFVFLPGVKGAMKKLCDAGYRVAVVTNQRGVARGMMSLEQVEELHRKMCMALEVEGANVDGIYICPHGEGECHCRKPDIGLFLQAERDFTVDKDHSWMIGDSETDMIAGECYGVRTILVGSDETYGSVQCKDLLSAVEYILSEKA